MTLYVPGSAFITLVLITSTGCAMPVAMNPYANIIAQHTKESERTAMKLAEKCVKRLS